MTAINETIKQNMSTTKMFKSIKREKLTIPWKTRKIRKIFHVVRPHPGILAL